MELRCERVVIVKLFKKPELNENQAFVYNIIKFTFTSCILFTLLIITIILLLNTLPKEHILRNLNIGSRNTWITYLGTIFGGSLTLFGVAYSIHHNLKQRELDQEEAKKIELTKNRPYIVAESIKQYLALSNLLITDIMFRNLTATPIRELSVQSLNCKVSISALDYEFSNTIYSDSLQFIPEKASEPLRIKIELPSISKEGDFSLMLTVQLQFYNLTGEHKFIHVIYAYGNLRIRLDDSGKFNIIGSDFTEIYNEFKWDI